MYLTKKVEGAIEDLDVQPELGDEDHPFKLPRTLGAAELNAINALLKNSNITCKRNVGSELDELDAALARSMKGKQRVTDADIADAIESAEYRGVH